jgi:hypothetical protein
MTSSPRTNVLAYPAFASLKRGPSANNPALVAVRLHFAARNRAYGYRPHLLGLPRKIRRGISLRETTLCGCPLRGHGFATPHQYFAVPVTAAPRRVPNGKNPALVGLRLRFACGETARAVIGPTFWVCRAKSGAAFRCAKPPCAVVRFAAMTSSPRTNVLAYPAFAPLKRGPSANNPALVAVRLHFAARNRAYGYRPHRGRYFAVPVTAAPRRVPNGKNPALVGLRLRFACGETARAVIGPTGADVLAYPAFAPLKRGPSANNPHLIPHPLQREQQLVIHVERAPHAQAVYPVLRQPRFAHDLLYRARVHYIRYVFKNHPLTALCCLWERNCGTAAAS